MAKVYYPAGCEQAIPQHQCDPCESLEKGRISSAGFIKDSFVFIDPEDPNEWRAGILSKDIILIPEVRGTFDGGAEQEAPGYGRQSTKLIGYNFTSNFKDPNYVNNCDFYNAIKNTRNYKFFYMTETQGHISDNAVQVIPKNPVEEDINSDVVFDVTVKWAGKDLPCPFTMPAGIIEECFTVAP